MGVPVLLPIFSLLLSFLALIISTYLFLIGNPNAVARWQSGEVPILVGTSNWTISENSDEQEKLEPESPTQDLQAVGVSVTAINEGFASAFPYDFECRFTGVAYNATQSWSGNSHEPFEIRGSVGFTMLENQLVPVGEERSIEFSPRGISVEVSPPSNENRAIVRMEDNINPSVNFGCFLKYTGTFGGDDGETYRGETDVATIQGGFIILPIVFERISEQIKSEFAED